MSVENTKNGTEIRGVEAMEGDPSLWATAAVRPSYQNRRGQLTEIPLRQGVPRGYLRIIPAGLEKNIPHPRDVKNLHEQENVQIIGHHNWGRCKEGFVDITILESLLVDAAMWFEKTGEYWIIHESAVTSAEGESRPFLHFPYLIEEWYKALRAGINMLYSRGASPECRVEAGVAGIMGVRFSGNFSLGYHLESFKNEISVSYQLDNWDDKAQRALLHDAFNDIRDCFDMLPLNLEDFEKKVDLKPIAD